MNKDLRGKLDFEFELAARARADGNEGRARVCARRAAGIAIREYMTRRGISISSTSAYDLINQFAEIPEISPHLMLISTHLAMRVSEDFKLPVDIDLMEESRQLCRELLPELI